MEVDLELILKNIAQAFPNIEFQDESDKLGLSLSFKSDFQKDFYYIVSIDNEIQHATVGAQLNDQSKGQYFWFYDLDYFPKPKDAVKTIIEFIIETLDIISKKKTRIIQNKRLLFQSFTLEYSEDNKWIELNKISGFRFLNLEFPEIKGKKKVYS